MWYLEELMRQGKAVSKRFIVIVLYQQSIPKASVITGIA
jgi:hypothetical protein